MEKIIANKITDWCFKKNEVTDVQKIAIQYGIELFLDSVLKILFLICIGAAFGKGIEMVIVIGCFCLLRKEAGGIHMQSGLGCFLSMCVMSVTSIVGAEFIQEIPTVAVVLIYTVSLVIIYYCAPYSTSNNPITDSNIIQRKKRNAITIVVVAAAVSLVVQENYLRALILIPVIIEIITILPLWRRKEERTNDECKFTEEDG